MNDMKVFIAGCGRSGTTYLRMLIDSHPDVFIPLESLFLVDYLKYEKYIPKNLLYKLLLNEPFLKTWYKGNYFKKNNVPDTLEKIHKLAANNNNAKYWGQKTPRFIQYMDLFNNNFENIKWILIYRDPRAVVASMLRTKNQTYIISKACKRWKKNNKIIIDILKSKNKKENIIIIKYEDLIQNFENVISDIFKFLGIDNIGIEEISSMEDIPNVVVSGAKNYKSTITKGLIPNNENINSWERTLTKKQILYIEEYCFNEMEHLDYKTYSDIIVEKNKLPGTPFFQNVKDILYFYNILRYWPKHAFYAVLRKSIIIFFYYLNRLYSK